MVTVCSGLGMLTHIGLMKHKYIANLSTPYSQTEMYVK